MENFDHISRIISEAMRLHLDISPADRGEWVMWCNALKVLGYDFDTFVALSNCTANECRRVWNAERHPHRYVRDAEAAAKKVVYFAKEGGLDVKQFYLLRDGETTAPTITPRPTPTTPPPSLPPVYLTGERLTTYLKPGGASRRHTALYHGLCRYFDHALVDAALARYYVGGAAKYIDRQGHHAIVFPYVNAQGRCRDAKVMHIDRDTLSRKKAQPTLQTWVMCWENIPTDRRAPWCLFGEHLLRADLHTPVAIVESEKTAIIASIVFPEFIWLAVGGLHNFKPDRLAPCKGRRLRVFPDRDGHAKWREICEQMTAEGYEVTIDTTTQRHPGGAKDDIADVILRYLCSDHTPTPPSAAPSPPDAPQGCPMAPDRLEASETWQRMKANHPDLATLESVFKLTPIRVTTP